MSKYLKQRLEDRLIDLSWLTGENTQGLYVNTIRSTCKEIARLVAEMSGYEEEEEPEEPDPAPPGWEPDFPDRKEILALPLYDEYRIHYMGLAGWAYRNIDKNPDMVKQQIYEIARRTRKAGAKYLRSFLMNGSRKASERYIMDALPWEMIIKDGRKVIEFDIWNYKYWDILEIIEEACKYWGIQHMPTFWMEQYNDDIFNGDNNVQGIHGFWSDESIPVKIKFMQNFMDMQIAMRNIGFKPTFEFINEPICWGNHTKLARVADHHLALWRRVEGLTDIRRAITCSGGCEGAHANFVEKHYFDGRWFGSDEFKDRKVTAEWHGVSTLQSLYDKGFVNGLGSGWKHLAFNEDGAGDGSYSPIPWTNFKLANSEELYDMQYHGHTECLRKGKKFYHTVFMLDCLHRDVHDNFIPKEEFNRDQLISMNWDRTMQYGKMREDLK